MLEVLVHFLIGTLASSAIFLAFTWLQGVRRFSAPFVVFFIGLIFRPLMTIFADFRVGLESSRPSGELHVAFDAL